MAETSGKEDHPAAQLATRLCEALRIEVPVIGAPMAGASGAELAAAVARAGGLGLLATRGLTAEELAREYARAQELAGACTGALGFGFFNFLLDLPLLEAALACNPRAVWLAFGDYPAEAVAAIKVTRTALVCQVRSLEEARAVVALGADVVVVQGSESGGHGASSASTFVLVPEAVDAVREASAQNFISPPVPVVAAGGIADGRQIAAALVLGATGAVLGTRLAATPESQLRPEIKAAYVAAGSDAGGQPATLRTTLYDELGGIPWPQGVDGRCLANAFTAAHHQPEPLAPEERDALRAQLDAASAGGRWDPGTRAVWAGQGVGLIRSLEPAEALVRRLVAEAARALARTVATSLPQGAR